MSWKGPLKVKRAGGVAHRGDVRLRRGLWSIQVQQINIKNNKALFYSISEKPRLRVQNFEGLAFMPFWTVVYAKFFPFSLYFYEIIIQFIEFQ